MNAWGDADRVGLGVSAAGKPWWRREPVLDNGDHQWQFMF
jgi:hypothetical protein